MIAKEEGKTDAGYSALVIKLPSSSVKTVLEFSETYYLADYPESGTGVIELEKSISLVNADDPTSVALTFDSKSTTSKMSNDLLFIPFLDYNDNFESEFKSGTWYINIKNSLSDEVLKSNTELVTIITAKENGNEGHSVLVIRLPSSSDKLAPEFKEAYYLAEYPSDGSGVIEFEKSISFTNIKDLSSVIIGLDSKYHKS